MAKVQYVSLKSCINDDLTTKFCARCWNKSKTNHVNTKMCVLSFLQIGMCIMQGKYSRKFPHCTRCALMWQIESKRERASDKVQPFQTAFKSAFWFLEFCNEAALKHDKQACKFTVVHVFSYGHNAFECVCVVDWRWWNGKYKFSEMKRWTFVWFEFVFSKNCYRF